MDGLGADTAGVVNLEMCRAAGLPASRVRWLVESGRWQRLHPRVFATFSGPVDVPTRRYATLLYAGRGAALSHRSAGALWGLCAEPPVIHVVVPSCRKVDPQPGLVIHRSRTLSHAQVHPTLLSPRTRVERTVVDLLAEQPTADRALGLVADALREGLSTAPRLRDAVNAGRGIRWRRVVLEAIPDLTQGARSVLELRDAAMRRAHGLPAGRRQVRRRHTGVEYLDVLVEEFGLHVELDGRLGHDRGSEIWRDMRRDNASELRGLRHLRYGWADLVDRPCAVAAEQAQVLAQQGWTGRLRRCSRCPGPAPRAKP
jgi:hypothetical protein